MPDHPNDENAGKPMNKRIEALRKQVEDLRARLPKHSVPAAMLIELEDLEDELAELEAQEKAAKD